MPLHEVSPCPTKAEDRLRIALAEGGGLGEVKVCKAWDGSRVIVVSGAILEGSLDLTSEALSVLVLRDCSFETLKLDDSHARAIELQGCTARKISAKRLVVDGGNGDLTFASVTVSGTVDLSRARIGGRLICHNVTIRGACGSGDQRSPAFKCRRVKIEGDVDFNECHVEGEVDFVSAEVGGTITYTGSLGYPDRATSRDRDRVALRCDGMHVEGSFRIGDPDDAPERATVGVLGEVRLVEANVEGDVNLTSAQIDNAGGTALDAKHLIVGEDLYLDRGFVANGLVQLVGARVTQLVNCTGGTFCNQPGPAIDASGLVAAGVYFNSGKGGRKFVAEGGIVLEGAQIARQVLCSGAKISASGPKEAPVAIGCDRIVAGDISLDEGCEVRGGSVKLGGAQVAGGVYCTKGSFEAPNGFPAMWADGAELGSLFLQGDFIGEVSLKGAVVKRELNCTGGRFHNPHGRALTADRLTCGNVYLDKSFVAEGTVSLWGATVGFVDCRGGTVRGEESIQRMPTTREGYKTYALDLAGTEVKQHVLAQGVRVEGGLTLADADISGDLDLTKASITPTDRDRQGTVLDGRSLAVGGTLRWRPAVPPSGRVDVSDARVEGQLCDCATSWPRPGRGTGVRRASRELRLTGFRYGSLQEGVMTVPNRLRWLASAESFSQQPYEELARVYRDGGGHADAQKVKVAAQQQRTRRGGLSPLSRVWNLFLEWTVGYGYKPHRILGVLAAFAIVGAFLFHVAQHNEIMEPVGATPQGEVVRADSCDTGYPCFHPAVYSVELLIPLVNLRQTSYWLPDMHANTGGPWYLRGIFYLAYTWVAVLLGWVSVTALAAGIGRVWRSD